MKIFVPTINLLLFIALFVFPNKIFAQIPYDIFKIDTVAVKVKSGFTPEDFIKATQKDTSFYRAFKNLRVFPHREESKIWVFDKEAGEKANLKRSTKHYNQKNYAWIVLLSEKTEGKFYTKKKEHHYFTAEMFDKVFFPRDTFFASNTIINPYQQKKPENRSKTEKYYEQLKTFMFSPGTGVDGVPLIGDKLDIFSPQMRKFYDFTVQKVNFQDSIPCYLFACKRKKEFSESKVVIQSLETFYDRRTMNIIARKYQIKDSNPMFSFDIKMDIRLIKIKQEYFPQLIRYDGQWNIPLKKKEKISFEIKTFL